MADPEITSNWGRVLLEKLAVFGHRNWVVVADSAYPAQSRHGIETVVTGADHLDVVKSALAAIQTAKHIRPKIHADLEQEFVTESDAPGITKFREELKKCFGSSRIDRIAHEEVIAKLDQAAGLFQVLVLKTTLTLPYTSVFFELDCGYWNEAAEHRLRNVIASRL